MLAQDFAEHLGGGEIPARASAGEDTCRTRNCCPKQDFISTALAAWSPLIPGWYTQLTWLLVLAFILYTDLAEGPESELSAKN